MDPTDRTKLKDPNRRDPDITEVYDNLSADPESPDYFKKKINRLSDLIEVDLVPGQENQRPADDALKMLADPNDNPAQFDGSKITAADYDGKEEEFTGMEETVSRTKWSSGIETRR